MARTTLTLVLCGLMVLQAAFAVAAFSEKKRISSVSLEGVVFCDQCLQQKITKSSNLLKGAKVAIVCEGMRNGDGKASMVASTDGKGRFQADLPAKLFDEEGNIKCSATLHSSPHASCRLPSHTVGISSTEFSRSPAADASHITYRVTDLSFHPATAAPLCAQAFYYEPAPEYKPPFEKPPFEKPPMEKPPMEKPPKEKPHMEKPPQEKPPMEKPPMEKPPEEKPPMEKPPVDEPNFEFPKFNFPKFNFPKFKFPKLHFPKYKFPKFDFPKYKFPKFDFPKDKYPKYPPQP